MLYRRGRRAWVSAGAAELVRGTHWTVFLRRLSLNASWLGVIFLLHPAFSQTTINLAAQSHNADFSTFSFTRTVSVGTSLPATCQIGQLVFDSAAAAGANLFGCSATNTWSLLGATPGNYLTGLTGDVTASGPGSARATLATVNNSSGQCGDASHVCQITTNAKGLVTAQTAVAVSGGGGSGVTIQQNGGSLGTATTINFTTNMSASVSGGTATVSSSSGGGGTTIVASGYLVTYNSGTGCLVIQAGVSASACGTGSTTDTARIYIDSTGNLTVADSSSTVNCTGCTWVSGVSAFPSGSQPIATWSMPSGQFSSSGMSYYSNVPTTFATLDACSAGLAGMSKAISDSTIQTWGATVTGGGSLAARIYCDGTNWTVMAK